MGLVSRSWDGMEFEDRVHRAAGRAIVAIALNAAVDTKRITHKVSGTLARSVHVAPLLSYHDDDEHQAQVTDLMLGFNRAQRETVAATQTPLGPVVEVGSWISYACVEWVGRMHPGITQGVEMQRGARADTIVRQAFFEEGL